VLRAHRAADAPPLIGRLARVHYTYCKVMVETHLFIGEESSFRIGRSHRYACVTGNGRIERLWIKFDHFDVCQQPPRTLLSNARGALWSYTSCVFRFNLLKAYQGSAEGRVGAAQPQLGLHGGRQPPPGASARPTSVSVITTATRARIASRTAIPRARRRRWWKHE